MLLVYSLAQSIVSSNKQCDGIEDIRLNVIKHLQWFKEEIYELKNSMKTLQIVTDVYGIGYVDVFENNAYLFARSKHSWTDSQQACNILSAALVHSVNETENNFLKNRMNRIGGEEDFWIGAQKIRDQWVWTSNDQGNQTVKWFDWGSSQPDGSGKCIQMWRQNGYQWDDDGCDVLKRYVCVKDLY